MLLLSFEDLIANIQSIWVAALRVAMLEFKSDYEISENDIKAFHFAGDIKVQSYYGYLAKNYAGKFLSDDRLDSFLQKWHELFYSTLSCVVPHPYSLELLMDLKKTQSETIGLFGYDEGVMYSTVRKWGCPALFQHMRCCHVTKLPSDATIYVVNNHPHVLNATPFPDRVPQRFKNHVACLSKTQPRQRIIQAPFTMVAWEKVIKLKKTVQYQGKVIHGYGRGAAEINCPTANLDLKVNMSDLCLPGVYIGKAQLLVDEEFAGDASANTVASEIKNSRVETPISTPITVKTPSSEFYSAFATPTEMRSPQWASPKSPQTPETVGGYKSYNCICSIGYNPHYKNKKLSFEVHIFHEFDKPFYERELKVQLSHFLRVESTFESFNFLLFAIQADCEVTYQKLYTKQ